MISVRATPEILDRLDKIRSFKNSLTGDTTINDIVQQHAEFAERCVMSFLRASGLVARYSQSAEEANFWDILCAGKRIDIKNSAHPKAKCLIYPYTKKRKLLENKGRSVDFLLATSTSNFPESCELIGAAHIRHFIDKMKIAKQMNHLNLREGTMFLEYDELPTAESFIEFLRCLQSDEELCA